MDEGNYVYTFLIMTLVLVSISFILFWIFLPNFVWVSFVVMPLVAYFITNIFVKRKAKKEADFKQEDYMDDDLYK